MAAGFVKSTMIPLEAGDDLPCDFLTASRHGAHAILKPLPEASAQPQSTLGFQYDLVLASVLEFQPMDPIEVHDDRAVNADKLFVAQVPLKLQQRPTHDV